MKKTNIVICDDCKRVVANKKCSFCEKDICEDCGEEVEIGTVTFNFCKACLNKLERSGYERPRFWDEFNKQGNMQEKIITYLKKSLILKNLSDDEEDEEEYEPKITHRKIARKKLKRKTGIGSWAEAMRDTISGDSI